MVKVSDLKIPTRAVYSMERTGVTQGLLIDFLTCRQKFLYRINGWQPIEEKVSDPLYFGSLCHHVLEKFYSVPCKFPGLILEKWIKEYTTKNPQKDTELLVIKARILLTQYFKKYAKQDLVLYSPERVEETFEVITKYARLRGRKDLVFKGKNKKIGMMEHKTKSRIDLEFLGSTLSQDTQNSFYDMSEFLIHGHYFDEIVYNVLRSPSLKPKAKETIKEFEERLREDISLNESDYFYRFHVTLTKEERSAFSHESDLILKDMAAYMEGKLAHYRNRNACQTPYRCKYLKPCNTGFLTGFTQKKIIFPELEES